MTDWTELTVPMSDGACLSTLRLPAPTSPAPAVVMMTPYRKEVWANFGFVPRLHDLGYEVIVADVRGFGGSVAPYEGLFAEREIQDGVELLEWVAAASFCDGNTATVGSSYLGLNQLLFAARAPEGLRCIVPWINPCDTYRDWANRGGIPSNASWGAVTYPRAGQEGTMRRGLAEYYLQLLGGPDDEAHRRRSAEYVFDRITTPALVIGGWHDFFLRGTIRTFEGVRGPKRLLVGPWSHMDMVDTQVDELVRWLDYWVRGIGDDPSASSNVVLYRRGGDEWQTFDAWPATETSDWESWWPFDDEAAVPVLAAVEAVAAGGPPPANPLHVVSDIVTGSGFHLWGEAFAVDGPVLDAPLSLLGHVGLALRLRSDECADVDVHARLSAVAGDGRVATVAEGRLRASHRAVDRARSQCTPDGDIVVPWHPHATTEPLTPGTPVELAIELQPTCVRLAAGDRLRLGLTVVRSDGGPAHGRVVTALPGTRVLLPVATSGAGVSAR